MEASFALWQVGLAARSFGQVGGKKPLVGWRQGALGRLATSWLEELATTTSRWIFGLGGNVEWAAFWVGDIMVRGVGDNYL